VIRNENIPLCGRDKINTDPTNFLEGLIHVELTSVRFRTKVSEDEETLPHSRTKIIQLKVSKN
jgi:hypothetical protein